MTKHPATVRLALASQAGAIARIQLDAYRRQTIVAQAAANLDLDEMTLAWNQAINRPPLATFRVLVALDTDSEVAGFAAVGPSDDPDAEPADALVAEFCVAKLGAGHEDRLLNAVVDTLRADGFERATWWVLTTDDLLRAWLQETGWQPDGAHRTLGNDDAAVIHQVRLHTSIEASS